MLLPDELRTRLPPHSTSAEADPMVHARYILAGANEAWYVIEGESRGDDFLFFGFIAGQEYRFGYFALSELEAMTSPLGQHVERDLAFTPGRLTDVVPAPDL